MVRGVADLLNLHFDATTISIPFNISKAKDLKASVEKLMCTFAEKQSAERPKRWPAMEYRFKGENPVGIPSFGILAFLKS